MHVTTLTGGWPGMAAAGEVDHAGRFITDKLYNGRAAGQCRSHAGKTHFLKFLASSDFTERLKLLLTL